MAGSTHDSSIHDSTNSTIGTKPSRHGSSLLNILIVGAGLSGLAAGIECALSSHSITILESAPELGEVGAGLQVTPNASKLLKRFGLTESFWASVAQPSEMNVRRYSNGQILHQEKNWCHSMDKEYGGPFVNIHRVDLQQALFKRAQELGVKFAFGERVVKVDVDDARVTTEADNVYEGDLIIGADGLWSRCRESFLGRLDKPNPTGDIVYRICLHIQDISDQDLRDFVQNPTSNFWVGPDSHVVSYSLRAGNMLNIVLMTPDNLPPDVSRKEGSVEEMRQLFFNWDPLLSRLLNLVPQVDKWRLMHRPEMETWINKKANFALIGDACHPMVPYLAQGASSSIEDGAVIGSLLGKISSKDQLPQALSLYQSMRKSRGEAIARESYQQRAVYHYPDGPEQEARDAMLKSHSLNKSKEKSPFRWTCPVIQPWLFGYDAHEEVEKAVSMRPFRSVL